MESPHPLSSVDEATWNLYRKKLTLHARNLMLTSYWRGEASGSAPGGKEAEDIAMEAILAICTGERRWDEKEQPDLLRHLFSVVKSKVSNLKTSAENRSETRMNEESHLEVADKRADVCQMDDDDFVLELHDYLKAEPTLLEVVNCIFEGITERAEIAAKLGVSVSEITNRRKKLVRKLRSFVDPALLKNNATSKDSVSANPTTAKGKP